MPSSWRKEYQTGSLLKLGSGGLPVTEAIRSGVFLQRGGSLWNLSGVRSKRDPLGEHAERYRRLQ